MSHQPTCRECLFIHPVGDDEDRPGEWEMGVCRRFPPVLLISGSIVGDCQEATPDSWSQPWVNMARDWCGEFKSGHEIIT